MCVCVCVKFTMFIYASLCSLHHNVINIFTLFFFFCNMIYFQRFSLDCLNIGSGFNLNEKMLEKE